MTPRQIERAVNAALHRVLPPMVQQLRDELVAEFRQQHGARLETPAPAALPVEAPIARKAETPDHASLGTWQPTPAFDPGWFTGSGNARRLTDAGKEELRRLHARGLGPGRIARDLGMSTSSVLRQIGILRAAEAALAPAAAAAAPAARTVAVVPAAEVEAPRQPAMPTAIGVDLASGPDRQVVQRVAQPALSPSLPRAQAGGVASASLPRDPQSGRAMPTPPEPIDPAQMEPVPASYEDALDWLFAHLAREKMATAEIEARLASLSTKQLLATCNAQRVKAGLSPYVLRERAA